MTKFGLATYNSAGEKLPAVIVDEKIYDLGAAVAATRGNENRPNWAGSVNQAIESWEAVSADVDAFAVDLAEAISASKISPIEAEDQLLAPFKPNRIFGTASNYHEHAAEMETVLAAKSESSPYIFMKATSSVIGTNATVIIPPETEKPDWEVELGVVIGRGGRRISVENAVDHIAGYTVVNDVSARDMNRRSDYPFKHDWFRGKSWDTFCPMGPCFVPASGIEDPHNIKLNLTLNGEMMQDGNTSELIWNAFEQIAYLSSILTLQPGDLIMTGTPAGVGMGRGLFLKPGDVMVASAEGIGSIRNPVEAEQL